MMAKMLWTVGAVVVGVYILLFAFARRPVTLRLTRVGWMLASIACMRLLLAASGVRLAVPFELTTTVLIGVPAVAFPWVPSVWLVRSTAEELRERIATACRGLLVGLCEHRRGQLQLATRGGPTMHLRRLSPRVQLLVLCGVTGSPKAALFYNWLAKQYPGPVPRVRIVVKGDDL